MTAAAALVTATPLPPPLHPGLYTAILLFFRYQNDIPLTAHVITNQLLLQKIAQVNEQGNLLCLFRAQSFKPSSRHFHC